MSNTSLVGKRLSKTIAAATDDEVSVLGRNLKPEPEAPSGGAGLVSAYICRPNDALRKGLSQLTQFIKGF